MARPSSKPITDFGDPDWSKKFHVWRMDWDEKSIKLSVDDLLLNATDLEQDDQPGRGGQESPSTSRTTSS